MEGRSNNADRRCHQRIAYHLAVDVLCDRPNGRWRRSTTRDIGIGGAYAGGGLCLKPGEPIRVTLGRRNEGALQLRGRVARIDSGGAGLHFVDNSPGVVEMLTELLTPDWDGHDLLEGVMKIAPWYLGDDLAGWMRLASLVADWQRLTSLARQELRRSGGPK